MPKHATKPHRDSGDAAAGPGKLHDASSGAVHAAEQPDSRVRRAVRGARAGAADVRDRVTATSAQATGAIEASEVGPEVTRGASRAAGAALRHPVPTAIAAAYLAGFLKGHRRRRSR